MVTRTKKIFVGGLSTTTTLEEVRAYFAKFGEVKNISISNYNTELLLGLVQSVYKYFPILSDRGLDADAGQAH